MRVPAVDSSRRVAVLAAVGLSALLVLAVVFQSTLLSVLGLGGGGATCDAPEGDLAPTWSSWTFQGDLPVGLYDPVLFVEPDREVPYRLLAAPDDGEMNLYRSSDMETFTTVAEDVEGPAFASNFNWGQKVDGRYYLFRTVRENTTELWTGPSLTNLTNQGVVLNESDTGGYYDPETGTWHIYYQMGTDAPEGAFGPTTNLLGHATSTDAREWTNRGVALNVTDRPWRVGDPEVVRHDGRYLMFVDRTTDHPVYRVHLAVSENLSRFDPVGRVTTACGGDPKVRYLPAREEFVMLTEFSGEDLRGIGLRNASGPGNVSALPAAVENASG